MGDYHAGLAAAGPYECAEMAAERMGVAMLEYFAGEDVEDALRPLKGARIVRGHEALPALFGEWDPRGTGPGRATAEARGSRIIVAAQSHRWDPDGGPEYVELEFVVETAAGRGARGDVLAKHEKRVAAVRGILSGAGRAGSVALAQFAAGDASWTVYGWENGLATVGFEEGAWTNSQLVTVAMGLSG